MKKTKTTYVFLVYANPQPIVYGVYLNKNKALKYAKSLIDWRFERAKERNIETGFYHNIGEEKRETRFDERQKLIFSACLRIKDGLKDFSDDGCFIQVIRRNIS